MAAKQAGQSSADVAASPDRFPRRYRYPSSSSSSSSSSTSNFSPPRTPTDLVSEDSSSCSSCISLSSHVQRLIDTIDTRFKEIYVQFEHVSNRLSSVEESISDQNSIINELERDLSKLLQTSSIRFPLKILILYALLLIPTNCKSLPKLILIAVALLPLSISLNVSQINSLTLLPALMPPIRHLLMFLPLLPVLLSIGVVPLHPAPIIRLPSSSPRHIGPTDPNPSSPLQSRPLPTTPSRLISSFS